MPLSDEQIDKQWRGVDYTIPYQQFRIDVARAIESAATAPLLAQIAALEDKVKAAEQASRWESDLCAQALDSMKQLEAQLAEARKDAERYRWLKNGCNDKGTTATHIAKDLFGFEWNRSIDAAIAQEQPNARANARP